MNFNGFHNKRGIGLLELMLSLGIIAILLLMVTRYFSQARDSMQVAEAVKDINTLVQASFNWVEGQQDNFNSLGGICDLVNAGELPANWCPDEKNPSRRDPWGSLILVSGVDNSGGACGGTSQAPCMKVKVELPGAPAAACENISDIMGQHNMQRVGSCSAGGYVGYYPYVTVDS